MKPFFIVPIASFVLLATAPLVHGQVLFSYGKKNVTKAEFLKAFRKNPTANQSATAMKDYLPLYIHYKLKVQDAYDQGLHELPALQDEVNQYEEQLIESFIARKSNIEALVAEAMQRSQYDRLVRHFSIPFDPSSTASEQKAKQLADAAFAQLQRNVPFTKVLQQYCSDEETKQQAGSIGWITVFTLPYKYESAIYSVRPGTATAPVRGSDAYHLFYVEKERPAMGKRRLAQILIWQADATERPTKKRLADSVFQLIKAGRLSFEAAALQYSNDRTSYSNGGMLNPIAVGEYDSRFEEVAFSLRKPGEMAAPFETSLGWHILKLIDTIPAPKDTDENAMSELRQRIQNSDRADIAKKNFLAAVKQKLQFKEAAVNKNDLWRFTDSVLRKGSTASLSVNNQTLLFSIGNEQTFVENWIMYNRATGITNTSSYPARYEAYVLQSVNSYYRDHIAEYEPEFKEQLQEFKDANLLFAAMEKEVWSKAANDTAALQQYYLQHQTKYTWGNGALALMVTATDTAAAIRFKEQLLAQPAAWQSIAASMKDNIIADSGRFELTQLPLLNAVEYSKGYCSPFQHNELDNSYSFVYIFQLQPGGDIRSFEDAKGWVINDYQQILEQQWIAKLRKKYPVKINEPVWQALLRSQQ